MRQADGLAPWEWKANHRVLKAPWVNIDYYRLSWSAGDSPCRQLLLFLSIQHILAKLKSHLEGASTLKYETTFSPLCTLCIAFVVFGSVAGWVLPLSQRLKCCRPRNFHWLLFDSNSVIAEPHRSALLNISWFVREIFRANTCQRLARRCHTSFVDGWFLVSRSDLALKLPINVVVSKDFAALHLYVRGTPKSGYSMGA
jgi:hypothetical protein